MKESFSRRKKTSVDELNEKLYHRKADFKKRPRRKLHNPDYELKNDFPDDEFESWKERKSQRRLPTSFFKKVFLGVLSFFVLTLIVAGLSLYTGSKTVSGDLISLDILSQPFVDGGENLEVQVRIQNYNEQELQLPDLVLSYPKDSREGGEEVFLRRSLEDIHQGDQAIETFNLLLFGQEGDVRTITAKLEYRINGSNAIFFKETQQEVIIRSTPTVLSLDAPEEIVKGQIFEMDIEVASNSNTVVNNTLLNVVYPPGFELISTEPEPDSFDHVWAIPLLQDEDQHITIRGRLAALEGEGQSFKVQFGKQNLQRQDEIETIFNNLIHTVIIQVPFLSGDLVLNGEEEGNDVVIRGGGDIDGEITVTNTLNDVLQDASVVVHLEGNIYDTLGIRVQNGFFDSNTQTITWDKTTLQALRLLQPGEQRTLSFNLPTQDLVGSTGALSQPELKLSVDVSGVESNGNVREAQNISQARIIANSDISIVARVDHDEGEFENYGPMPPRVNQITSYTITLQVTNSSNPISGAELRFYLPSYVTWKDAIAPSVEQPNVSYNEVSREVVWTLGELRPGLGVAGSPPRSLSFQVELLPSSSQLGDQVLLTNDLTLTGLDTFTDTDLSYKKTGLLNKVSNSSEDGADGRIQN